MLFQCFQLINWASTMSELLNEVFLKKRVFHLSINRIYLYTPGFNNIRNLRHRYSLMSIFSSFIFRTRSKMLSLAADKPSLSRQSRVSFFPFSCRKQATDVLYMLYILNLITFKQGINQCSFFPIAWNQDVF